MYKQILVAVDFQPDDNVVIERALDIAKMSASGGVSVGFVHAVEHLNAYGVAEAYSAVLDVEMQLVDEAKKQILVLGQKYGLAEHQLHIAVGSPKAVVLTKANDLKADLVVVGSHGRHGLQFLLGSTADGVMHSAACDVLVVRVPDDA